MRFFHLPAVLFDHPLGQSKAEGFSRPHPDAQARTGGRPSVPSFFPIFRLRFPPILPLISHGFTAVAGVAQTLQVAPVDEPVPDALVILHMVHVRGPRPHPSPSALPAERLQKQLSRPQIVRPDGQAVPVVPLRALAPRRLLGLVLGAPSVMGQFGASWMTARPERLHGHGLSPPGKTKSARALTSILDRRRLRRWSIFDAGSGAGQ